MNWLSHFFKNFFSSKKNSHKKSSPEQTNTKKNSMCSEPSSDKPGHLSKDKIRQLIPLRNLDKDFFDYLPQRFLTYDAQATIFIHNELAEYTYYLLRGVVSLQIPGSKSIEINGNSMQATFPLSSGVKYGATAVSNSEVLILSISSDLSRLWTEKNQDKLDSTKLIDIDLPIRFSQHKFFQDFIETYQHNELKIPSLPGIAIKLRSAMKEEIGINEAVDIIQTDHSITVKLIKVANSPLYSPVDPIKNCHNAVNRLGLTATQNIVISLSLKQLFHSNNKLLMRTVTKQWKRSLYVSSLSFVLAEETGTIEPDDALLAGLICDIGIIPLLHFSAEYIDDIPRISELQDSFTHFRGPVGKLILQSLGFSDELSQIPYYSEDWYYNDGKKEIGLVDIVILAKLHSYFGTDEADNMPPIHTIPAYAKLKDPKLTPDLSLHVLHKAQKRIRHIMAELV